MSDLRATLAATLRPGPDTGVMPLSPRIEAYQGRTGAPHERGERDHADPAMTAALQLTGGTP